MEDDNRYLPLDVLRETTNHLGTKDLLKCQQVCGDFRQLVNDSNDLQLRMHLEENGIQATTRPAEQPPLDAASELRRLRAIEKGLSTAEFEHDPKHQRLRFGAGAASPETMNFVTIANGCLFTPWNYRGSNEGMGGIARYLLSDLTIPPTILELDRPIRHFQIDAAESLLLIVLLEDE
ncbi:hypothetical protein NCC49_000341 [Naganishia albida]|nr:hypothetical protein NCC49_000341 [Naganishia albida]